VIGGQVQPANAKAQNRPASDRPTRKTSQPPQVFSGLSGPHRNHLRQKLLAPGDLLVHRIAKNKKGVLFWHERGSMKKCTSFTVHAESGSYSDVPGRFLP